MTKITAQQIHEFFLKGNKSFYELKMAHGIGFTEAKESLLEYRKEIRFLRN